MQQRAGSRPWHKRYFLSGVKEPEQWLTQFGLTQFADTGVDPSFAVPFVRFRATASMVIARGRSRWLQRHTTSPAELFNDFGQEKFTRWFETPRTRLRNSGRPMIAAPHHEGREGPRVHQIDRTPL